MSFNEWSSPHKKSSLTQNATIGVFKKQLSDGVFFIWRILANFQNDRESLKKEKGLRKEQEPGPLGRCR